MSLRNIFAILFFTLLSALLALTYYPDLPDLKVRIKDEWFRLIISAIWDFTPR